MMQIEGLVIDDSPYAQQLRQPMRGLRFRPEIELEFREDFSTLNLRRQRTGFLVAGGLYSLFLLVRLLTETGPAAQTSFLLRSIIIGVLLGIVLISYSAWYRYQHIFVFAGYLIFSAGVTAIELVAAHHGVDRHYEGLIFITVHAYVFSGLVFRQAFAAAFGIFAIYAIGGWWGGLAGQAWAYELLFIILLNMLGATAAYQFERIARENFLNRKMLREMIGRDGMTGLHNRTAFLEHLHRVLAQASRDQRSIGLVMLDCDDFKAYNDRYGHLAGDEVLRRLGQTIRGEFRRPLDMFARYAGEEFVGVWFDPDPARLPCMADQICQVIRDLDLPHETGRHPHVSVSVGAISLSPQGGESLLQLIECADQALYAAKHAGRDQAVTRTLTLPQA